MLLMKTEKGRIALSERSGLFSSRQRAAFILFDGRKSLAEVLATMAPLGVNQADVDAMQAQGLLEVVQAAVLPAALEPALPAPSQRTDQERYLLAKPIATRITAQLGMKGFRLNLAVEAAPGVPALLLLLPKIQAAAGVEACRELDSALKG